MSSKAAGRTLDVSALLDRGMTPFPPAIAADLLLVTFFDGLDYSLISFTLPYLRDEMALTDEMTGFVSSAPSPGQMVGSLIGSFIADVVGTPPGDPVVHHTGRRADLRAQASPARRKC
jgi:AAHS family 4-hydroxybenzoate transporter-like MFS transporter